MGVLADHQIRHRLRLPDSDSRRMRIEPFADPTKVPGQVSYGLSHYGYDIRLGKNFLLFAVGARTPLTLDACTMREMMPTLLSNGTVTEYEDVDRLYLPPHGFALAESLERVRIPRDCMAQVLCKSTLARTGICLNMTPLEPEWEGVITLEIANLTPLFVCVHAGQGIGQIVFHVADGAMCASSYADKAHAQYQHQDGLTLPKV